MLVDAHAHVDRYGDLLEPALTEIREHRILTVATAMDLLSYQRNLEIAERCELVLPTFGVHPKCASEYAHRLGEISGLIEKTPAIGEIGLDYHWVEDSTQYPAQKKVLEHFLAAAREQRKIVNLHTKGAENEILNLLEHYDIQRAIVHWYSGPLDTFRAMVEFGVYFTVGVEILYSKHIQAITRDLPGHLLLTETDNPGGFKWLKGTPGMPTVLHDVIRVIAKIRQTTTSKIAQTVHNNFSCLIRNDPWMAGWRRALDLRSKIHPIDP